MSASSDLLRRIEGAVQARVPSFVALTTELARLESPSDDAAAQEPVFARLASELVTMDFGIRRFPGRWSGGLLAAVPLDRARPAPYQLLLGHVDTVWPKGTLESMPVRLVGDRLSGPGTFDMKAGLAMAVHALGALKDLELAPTVTPVLLVNSDEEIDSVESRATIERFSRRADRVWVLEPGQGPSGRFKSSRPGTALYHVTVFGRASHAGLAPEEGRSAILAMTELVQILDALNDPGRGILVNVGTVSGGIRRNVVPAECRFSVDVRTRSSDDAHRMDETLRRLDSPRDGISVRVEGSIERPPFDGAAPRHHPLLERALALASSLGMQPGHGFAGGASDGNFAAGFAPTLDGLGAVGDGAHAEHEHVMVPETVRRIMLLALLLLEPPIRRS